jgi:hypothetical protein
MIGRFGRPRYFLWGRIVGNRNLSAKRKSMAAPLKGISSRPSEIRG